MNLQDLVVKIKEELKNSLVALDYFSDEIPIEMETPKDKKNGDFSSNIAMKYARIARKSPKMIAEEIINALDKDAIFVEKVEIAGPGFINFFISKTFLTNVIKDINTLGEQFGSLTIGNGEHINVEFVSVNPTGSLHIGHARGAAAGDSICRILNKAGYQVTREYYVNDAGNQIHNLSLSIETRYKQQFGIDAVMPEDGYNGPEIIETAKEIIEVVGDKYLKEEGYEYFRKYGVDSLLDELKKDLNDFRVSFDVWFSEKSLYDNNIVEKTIQVLKDGGYTYELDGALWLRTTDFNDEKDRVIIKSDGTYTYLTPDIAYHKDKIDRGYTGLVDVLGSDHHGYIERLKAAIEMVGGSSDLLNVEILQMVKVLQDGVEVKMSKRSGKAITLRDVIEDAGVDSVRYFFAMRSLNTQMDLDLDLALKQTNENPVYYAQYAHARINSIFNSAILKGFDLAKLPTSFETLESDKAFELIGILGAYPDAVKQAATIRAPHKITNYINNLASSFHSFYNDEHVVTTDHQKSYERLALLNATKIVLKDALKLVGVSAPNKM